MAAASYEARKFGVHSAMPSVTASRKCPQLIFVKARFDVYKEVSDQIREIFLSYTDLVEPLQLDEAYRDVTENKAGIPPDSLIAREIKTRIKETTGLTASAGIPYNKFLAKTASDLQKHDRLTVIHPEKAEALIAALPIKKFYGIGHVTLAKMKSMGIQTGADLRRLSETDLRNNFGKSGGYLLHKPMSMTGNHLKMNLSLERF